MIIDPVMVIDVKDVCPQHGEATGEQIRNVLSKLNDEDLGVLNDTLPHVLYAELSSAAGARLLHRLAAAQAQVFPRPPS